MRTFDDYVADYVETCPACPTQYEGTLKNGLRFYFRYRYAKAGLGLGVDDHAAVADPEYIVIPYGDHPLDGCISEEEFKQLFVELMQERASK